MDNGVRVFDSDPILKRNFMDRKNVISAGYNPEIKKYKIRSTIETLVFVVPALVLLIIFKIYPIALSFFGSFFTESFLTGKTLFVGLENYVALFTDSIFINSILVTLKFNIITTPVQIVIALILALMVAKPSRTSSAFRVIFMMPIAIALTSACMLWNIMLNPNQGIVNSLLGMVGISSQPFFTSKVQAMMSMILICNWRGCGYWMLYLLTGIQDVSQSVLESARIDGAGRLRTIWSIILPMIKRSMMFVVVSDTISNLLMFIPVHMITLGGPEGSTDLLMYEAYKTGFVYADFGKSYAMVSLLIIFAFAVVMIEMKLLKPKY